MKTQSSGHKTLLHRVAARKPNRLNQAHRPRLFQRDPTDHQNQHAAQDGLTTLIQCHQNQNHRWKMRRGQNMKEYQIEKNQSGQRLDKFLAKVLKAAPKSFIYKMLRKKNITMNDQKATGNEILQLNDQIKLFLSDETFDKFSLEQGKDDIILSGLPVKKLWIIFEDEDILVFNKPAGMLSQKAQAQDYSANEYIMAYLYQKGELTQEALKTFRPSICNRLDRNTSGILLFGKSLAGLQQLSLWLNERLIQKFYLCVVAGQLNKPMHIGGYLHKDELTNKVTIMDTPDLENKPIETAYEPLGGTLEWTLLKVQLITGRSHQIRAHLSSIGHPILGDSKYDPDRLAKNLNLQYKIQNQMLHSWIIHTPDGRQWEAPVPEPFQPFIKQQRSQT